MTRSKHVTVSDTAADPAQVLPLDAEVCVEWTFTVTYTSYIRLGELLDLLNKDDDTIPCFDPDGRLLLDNVADMAPGALVDELIEREPESHSQSATDLVGAHLPACGRS
ncbi:hypothetical protein [Saccharothrix obliqua]|uniref:hypothetical protein n=1 Tax=Saccharothrix obliqua TaxID=2861747 RepID=UPI001C5D2B08|nr:hypothetical protein [Saccharothrix obliqua]MBW4722288.1 hypothetical protein [Saccharothrix obliqua]